MLTELLDPEALLLHYSAQDAEEVVRCLSQKLLDKGYVHETFADAALSREAELPTGLVLGGTINAAIPHTDVEHVIRPAVALATLARPVNFRHMIDPTEEVPVQIVFLLALEQPKSQVAMLQEVAAILQSPQLVENLVNASSADEILELIP